MSKKTKNKEQKAPEAEVEKTDAALAAELGLDETEVVTEVSEQEEDNETNELTEEASAEATTDDKVEPSKADLVVTDDAGKPIFKRMEPNLPAPEAPKKPRQPASYKSRTKQVRNEVSGNFALLAFPTDRFGLTKDVKEAIKSAASRIAGDENKFELFMDTLKILVEATQHKFKADQKYRADLQAKRTAAKEAEELAAEEDAV